MAKRRVKKRTHAGAASAPGNAPNKPGSRTPKSMVIRVGASEVGPSITQLVKDVRSMMEPETASRLKERRGNKLRDFTTMAGPLGVTHLLLFSRSGNGNTNLRLAVTPRGPTLHFRVEKYSLCKDVYRSQKRPKSGGNEYLAPPLLVMNNFSSRPVDGESETNGHPRIPKHLESLTTTIFQSLFSPINPTTTPLKGIKRVLLLDRSPQATPTDTANYTLNLRHYLIETRTAKSVPKPLRRLDAAEKIMHAGQKRKRGGLPNLGRLDDVADYLLDPLAAEGFFSGSDSEPDTDAEVEVLAPTAQKVQRRNAKPHKEGNEHGTRDRRDRAGPRVEKKGIKLHELGPRLKLRLTKVEEGLCAGKVMWHEYIHKSKEELRQMEHTHERRRREKEARRAEQRANVERKRSERRANGEEVEDEDQDVSEDDEWDDDEGEGEDGGVGVGADADEDEEMGDGDGDEVG